MQDAEYKSYLLYACFNISITLIDGCSATEISLHQHCFCRVILSPRGNIHSIIMTVYFMCILNEINTSILLFYIERIYALKSVFFYYCSSCLAFLFLPFEGCTPIETAEQLQHVSIKLH